MVPLTHIAFIRARPGCSQALGRRLAGLIAPSRAEPGCIAYDVHQSNEDPDLWFVHENWRSPEELAAHLERPHMQHFANELPALIKGDLTLGSFTRTSAAAFPQTASAASAPPECV
ncbi:putative quinol monooxygenase [Sphingomonas oleivorans]|nr:putative quinol monooxygenase [Sphingomonas oleivorans]